MLKTKLKCWKKVSDELWENKNKTELILDKLDSQWNVMLFNEREDDLDRLNMLFGTPSKKEATWFAKRYMKNHDRC